MSGQTPLVGRVDELARLAEAVESAQRGEGSLLLLAGEAGVGKSRLAQEAAADAETVLYGAASNGATVAYGPIVAALRSRLRSDPDALADCGSLLPHLALLLPELGRGAEESERATIFEAVRCAFAHLGAERPAIVVLDDLQWSDDTSLELLAALAGPLREMPGLLPRPGRLGLELVERDEVPVPDSIREAILVGIGEVSSAARESAETAAVLGQRFDLGLAASLTPPDGLAELIEVGLLEERGGGRAAF